MKLIIDVPKKEFGVEIADHFQDFFRRIKAEIEERLISNDTLVCGNYELEIAEMFLKSFKNATLEQQEPKTDIAEKIHKMKSEIANSLEFWDYSPNNNPLARDMLEIITNFWGEVS